MAYDKDLSHMLSLGLESNAKADGLSSGSVFAYHRGLENVDSSTPILALIHGYPQSSFEWRHIIPLLPSTIPLYIPDLPGYGRSPALSIPHNKRNVGEAILSHLASLLGPKKSKQRIILCGHDRGARVCHRLSVDKDNQRQFDIQAAILIDIVPTIVQWQTLSNPTSAAFGFHWPLLANVSLATAMISAYGGDKFIRELLSRWAGKNEVGNARFAEQDAVEVYARFFNNAEVVKASCDDYRAGAEEDVDVQKQDQEEGRKLDVPTLLIYAADFIGKRNDMKKVWTEWVSKGGLLEEVGVGEGIGHFVPEESPEKTAEVIQTFYSKITSV